jgi:hypothetical protein
MSASGFFFSPQTTLWPTPTERDHRSVYASPDMHSRNARPLSEAAGRWATPLSSNGEKGSAAQAFGRGNTSLPGQAAKWSTPTVADTEGGRANRSKERSGELLMRGQALLLHSRQDPTTLTDGSPFSRFGLTLNPLFVESLMNWPPGWSALAIGRATPEPHAWTGCVYSAAVLSRWRRLMRSALLQQSLLEPLPAQLDLFG